MSMSLPPQKTLLNRLSPLRLVMAAAALVLILVAWWAVFASQRGLINRSFISEDGVPLQYMAPEGASGVPGVVVAHGFAGSKQLMYGYGNVFARAGYAVILLDFDGHGANGGRLDREGDSLERNLTVAYEALMSQSEVDAGRVALLGHSMGSGAVMSAGIEQWEQYQATIAVSPTGADVSSERPRNLLLQAGALEPQFAANARELLVAAGGENDDFDSGRARRFVTVPNVEHITILFSRASHQSALDWLNTTYGLASVGATPDRRMLWYVVHLAGWLLLLSAAAPLFPKVTGLPGSVRRPLWSWLGLPLGAAAAVGVVALLGRLTDIGRLGGLLVGGTLGLWFLVMGLVWLLSGFRPTRPSTTDLVWGLILFVVLTLAFGVMAQLVWLPWWLIPERLVRWPFLAAAAFPWLLAGGFAAQHLTAGRRFGWWLLQTVVTVAGLGLAVLLSPGLFFVVLLMPVIPIILAIMMIAGAAIDRPWSYALGNALFFGWLLVAVFPLA